MKFKIQYLTKQKLVWGYSQRQPEARIGSVTSTPFEDPRLTAMGLLAETVRSAHRGWFADARHRGSCARGGCGALGDRRPHGGAAGQLARRTPRDQGPGTARRYRGIERRGRLPRRSSDADGCGDAADRRDAVGCADATGCGSAPLGCGRADVSELEIMLHC